MNPNLLGIYGAVLTVCGLLFLFATKNQHGESMVTTGLLLMALGMATEEKK